jgi:hypothetical protein
VEFKCSATAVTDSARLFWWLQHPRSARRPARPVSGLKAALWIWRRAPVLAVHLSDGFGGQTIAAYLGERRAGLRWRLWSRSVIEIPAAGTPAFRGRAMQALRTNVSRARREGLTCQTVPLEDGHAGEHLFHLLDAEGSVQGASCVTRDQDWAVVNYMLSSTHIGTYLLHAHVVSAMQQLGVRHLLITSGNVLRLNPGLLYLQARLGYSVVNLHLARTPRAIGLAELRRADHALELRLRAGSGSGPGSSQGEGIWCPPALA